MSRTALYGSDVTFKSKAAAYSSFLFCCLRFVLVVLLSDCLPVTAAADIYSRRVNIAERSAICSCWEASEGDLLLESSCATGEVVTI